MFNTDPDGFVHPTGSVAGGHAIVCFGGSHSDKYFKLHNSWGPTWGQGGACKVKFDDMAKPLDEYGEACIPIKRKKVML